MCWMSMMEHLQSREFMMVDVVDIVWVALGLYTLGVLSGVVFIILGLYFYLKPSRAIVLRIEEKGMLQLNVKEEIFPVHL